MKELHEWQWPYECKKCNSIIYSKKSGEFVVCDCGDSFVDQTPYYMRGSGPCERLTPEQLKQHNITIKETN